MKNKKNSKNTFVSLVFLVIYILTFLVLFFVNMPMYPALFVLSFSGYFLISLLMKNFDTVYLVCAHFFMYFAKVLGSGAMLYKKIHNYDLVLHFISGILLVFIFEYILRIYSEKKGISFPKTLSFIFYFSFATACAGLWKIFEFSGDALFGFSAQGGNLTNTVMDIIMGTTGGILGCGIIFLKNKSFKK